jgi:NADPH:quinone reductase
MRAIVVHKHGPVADVRFEEVADPIAGRGEVLIETRAIGLNFPDVLVIEGTYQKLPPRPFSPGKELAGVVRSVGADVVTCKPGDRVLALVEYGAYAELVAVPQQQCFVMPESMPFVVGAAMGVAYQTAYFALIDRGQYASGETVLVTGASGGVGLACVEVAKALGATVIAGVTSESSGELVRRHGADHMVNLAEPDLRESLRLAVREVTAGRGADIVLDPVGGDVFDASLRALAWRGRLVVIGFAAGRIPEVKANYLLVRNISVTGLQISDYRERDVAWWRRVQQELFELYRAGKLHPHVSIELPLERFAEGLALFRKRGMQGKAVLVCNESEAR